MTWQDITVKQYQQLYPIISDATLSELDVVVEVVSLLEGLAVDEIDSWPSKKLFEKQKEYAFLYKLEPTNPKSFIEANGKRYHFVHEVEKMPAARYIEAKHFAGNSVIENLHKIMASCVIPMKKKWFGWVDDKYQSKDHAIYAADLQQASFVEVYNCVVFFCQLYAGWIITSKDYLVQTYSLTMTREQALILVEDLCKLMGGNITPKQWQSLNALPSMKHTNSPA